MANIDCNSCNELVDTSPDFVEKGVTTAICNSLKNDTGFNTRKSHTDCEDLDTANDCLVGMMDKELEKYEPCDWKLFMHKFIPNIHQFLKAMICAICGLWTNVHALWEEVAELWRKLNSIEDQSTRIDCIINNMTKQSGWNVGPENIRWAPGVTARPGAETNPLLAVPHMSGNGYCGYMTGSISISQTWIDAHPNSELNTRGALLYEYRIKLSDFKLKNIFAFNLQETANGQCVHAHGYIFKAGDTTLGNNKDDTTGSSVVPEGYIYIQVRMSSYESLGNGNITLSGVMPVITDISKLDC